MLKLFIRFMHIHEIFSRRYDHALDNIYVDSFYLLGESNKIVDENVIGNRSQKYRNYRSNKEGS